MAGGENAIRKAKDGEEALEINETTEMDLIFKANVADSKFKMRIRVGRIFGGGKIRGWSIEKVVDKTSKVEHDDAFYFEISR